MFDVMDKETKNNSYRDILNSQSHKELLDCLKRTPELKERFSGIRLNRVNCTKEKIINAFLSLYEKNKIIEKIIMDMRSEEISKYKKHIAEGNSKQHIEEYTKLKELKEERGDKMNEEINKTIRNTDKSTEDLMDFSVREFINNINELKDENEKLKAIIESGNTEITKHKAKALNNNTEITKLSDKLKVANSIIKEKNSLIANLSTRMDKLEKNLNEKFESLEKEVKKAVPAVDKTRELVEKNNNTLKEILVNVKEERKSLSKLQNLESEITGMEDKITEKVLDGIKAIIQDLCIDKREVYAHNNEEKHKLSDTPCHIKGKDEIKTHRELKEEVITQEDREEEDDELNKMLNDIKSAIM